MINKSRKIRFLSLMLAALGILLAGGNSVQVSAQRDPFAKSGGRSGAARPSTPRTSLPTASGKSGIGKPKLPGTAPVMTPAIQDRIAYYKRLREAAAMQNQPIPKVTTVLTLDEMSVIGIFRTPRGYAAMVEAKPIKLSYTIYPGEKFFDGQLVAIEENKLVFRRVMKLNSGKFVTLEENKTLRQYTVEQEVQGTALIDSASSKTESATVNSAASPTDDRTKPAKTLIISSPLEEMNKQPAVQLKDSAKTTPTSKTKSRKGSTYSNKKADQKP